MEDPKDPDEASERSSVEGARQELPSLTKEEEARLEVKNGLKQHDEMIEMINASLGDRFKLRPSTILTLQRPAVEGLKEDAGFFRQGSIGIRGSSHRPPPAEEVSKLVEEMCDYINDHWGTATPIHIAAYFMWRHNWIHPFSDGNGRTSRVVSYLLLCLKLGFLLPGDETIPARIAGAKSEYYDALDHADAEWKKGTLDVSMMESLLEGHLAQLLVEVQEQACGKSLD